MKFIRSTFRWGATGVVLGHFIDPFWPTTIVAIVAIVTVHTIADVIEAD